MTGTWRHRSRPIAAAVRGSRSAARILSARRSVIPKRRSISSRAPVNVSPWPGRISSPRSSAAVAASASSYMSSVRGRSGDAASATGSGVPTGTWLIGFEEIRPSRWSPVIITPSPASTVSVGLCPGRSWTRQIRPPATSSPRSAMIRVISASAM